MSVGHDGCLSCPVQACSADYRGSQCKFLRSQAGVDTDPLTWAEKLRTMSAEDIADFICNFAGKSWFCEYSCPLREKCKIKAPAAENAMVVLLRTPVAQNKIPFPTEHLSRHVVQLMKVDSKKNTMVDCPDGPDLCSRCGGSDDCPSSPFQHHNN